MSGFPFTATSISAGDDATAAQYNALLTDIKQIVQDDQIAGETIDGTPVPTPVLFVSDIFQREYRTNFNFGDVSANTRFSVQIKPYSAITSTDVRLFLQKEGSPTGNLTIEIQGDSSGDPDGTAITNGTSNTVAMSGIATAFEETTFTFASAFTLAANTLYHIVLKRSDAVNASDFVSVLGIANDYANFVGKKYSGSAWSSHSLMFAEVKPTTGSSQSVWRSDANIIGLHWYDGFAITDATENTTVTVQIHGLVAGFTGLIANRKYFVQDTVGTIGISEGTYEIGVGEAISDTELIIRHYSNEYMGSESLTDPSPSTTSTTDKAIMYSDAKKVMSAFSASGDPDAIQAQLIVFRKGMISATMSQGPNEATASLSIGGSVVTGSVSSDTQNSAWSAGFATIYFYR